MVILRTSLFMEENTTIFVSVDGGTQYSSWIDNNEDFVFSGLAQGNCRVEIWDSAGYVNSDQITI